MYASVRRYYGATALIEALAARRDEIHALLASVPGFVAYYCLRSGDELTTVSICRDRAGTDETAFRAADWVRANLPPNAVASPEVTTAELLLDFAASPPPAYSPGRGAMHG